MTKEELKREAREWIGRKCKVEEGFVWLSICSQAWKKRIGCKKNAGRSKAIIRWLENKSRRQIRDYRKGERLFKKSLIND